MNIFATDNTDLVIDVNGYFAPPGPGGLSLYTVTPCRVLDSRLPLGSPAFSAPLDEAVKPTVHFDFANPVCGEPLNVTLVGVIDADVGINLPGIEDADFVAEMQRETADLQVESQRLRSQVVALVRKRF